MSEIDEKSVLYAEAILGKDAEEALGRDIVRYMLGCAEREEAEALEALAKVSSWRRRRIAELQAQIWRARSFKTWLYELVHAGNQALEQLESLTEET
jgi:hypothetical protein